MLLLFDCKFQIAKCKLQIVGQRAAVAGARNSTCDFQAQPSLRDGVFLRGLRRPWVKTHGYRQSAATRLPEPCFAAQNTATRRHFGKITAEGAEERRGTERIGAEGNEGGQEDCFSRIFVSFVFFCWNLPRLVLWLFREPLVCEQTFAPRANCKTGRKAGDNSGRFWKKSRKKLGRARAGG